MKTKHNISKLIGKLQQSKATSKIYINLHFKRRFQINNLTLEKNKLNPKLVEERRDEINRD